MKAKKCSSLEPPRGIFYKTHLSLAGCQIYLIDVNFYLRKSLEIFNKNSAVKNLIQKVPYLMSIRIKSIVKLDYTVILNLRVFFHIFMIETDKKLNFLYIIASALKI